MRKIVFFLVKNKGKFFLLSIALLISAVFILKKEVAYNYDYSDFDKAFRELSFSKGILPPSEATGEQFLDTDKKPVTIELLESYLKRDDNNNIIAPDKIIQNQPKVKSLTLNEMDEMDFQYSGYFDTSYMLTYPKGKRVITYIPIKDASEAAGVKCVGGNMKKQYDDQKPMSKEQCISKVNGLLVKLNYEESEQQRKLIEEIKKLRQEKAKKQKHLNELYEKLKNSKPLYAVNPKGICIAFKNVYRDVYLASGGTFNSYEECDDEASDIRHAYNWPENQISFAFALLLMALLSASPLILWIIIKAISLGASSASNSAINFLAKASKAINHDKNININANVKIRKDEDYKK